MLLTGREVDHTQRECGLEKYEYICHRIEVQQGRCDVREQHMCLSSSTSDRRRRNMCVIELGYKDCVVLENNTCAYQVGLKV